MADCDYLMFCTYIVKYLRISEQAAGESACEESYPPPPPLLRSGLGLCISSDVQIIMESWSKGVIHNSFLTNNIYKDIKTILYTALLIF